jgi:DNA-binding transcriptional ArsR family regulator
MDTKRYSNILKALSHPHRLNLFLEIARCQEKDYEMGECKISGSVHIAGIGAPTVSHHLKELSSAGLITTERKGKYLVAKINKEILDEVLDLFKEL